MISGNTIDELTREELLELVKAYAKNWLAHDGCWFLSLEEQYGISTAIDIDREAWRKFSAIEATRIKNILGLKNRPGVEGLRRALGFRLYATINEDMIEVVDDTTLRYYVKTCRVQAARRSKGLKDFPCASVGIVEYSYFARTIDDRFHTVQISCPPDITNHYFHCIWEFKIIEHKE
jgi:hypothetical protein